MSVGLSLVVDAEANDNYGAIALMCGRSAKLDSLVPGGSESQLNVRKCSNSRLKVVMAAPLLGAPQQTWGQQQPAPR